MNRFIVHTVNYITVTLYYWNYSFLLRSSLVFYVSFLHFLILLSGDSSCQANIVTVPSTVPSLHLTTCSLYWNWNGEAVRNYIIRHIDENQEKEDEAARGIISNDKAWEYRCCNQIEIFPTYPCPPVLTNYILSFHYPALHSLLITCPCDRIFIPIQMYIQANTTQYIC